MAEVSLHGISKRFSRGNSAVRDLNLHLESGKILAVVGPSGSGKSTLLRLIAGLEVPTAGAIFFDKKDVTRLPPYQRRTAVVFQSPGLYPHWNVRKNLALGLQAGDGWNWLRRSLASPVLSSSSISQKIEHAARVLGIDSLLDRFPAELSGGEQQRVALGRGLVQQPTALLLDEPFAHLDGVLRRELRNEVVSQLRGMGTTTLFVTHDPAEALAVCDQLAVIHQGQLLQVGTPQEIYDSPGSPAVARWGGTWGMNVWQGTVVEKAGQLWFSTTDESVPLPRFVGQQVKPAEGLLLGVRPEQLSLRQGTDFGIGIVKSVGFLGDGWLVTLEHLRSETVVVRLPPNEIVPKVGEQLPLKLRAEACHWFTANDSQRLKYD